MYAYKKEKPIVVFKFVALGDESGGDNFAELSADVEAAGGTCDVPSVPGVLPSL